MKYQIRPILPNEIPLLKDFLYEAIFQRDEHNLLPRTVIEQPEIKVYIEDFGKEDDNCLVAVDGDKIVGAVWTRILSGTVKGFGNIDSQTPEFAISLYKEYRGSTKLYGEYANEKITQCNISDTNNNVNLLVTTGALRPPVLVHLYNLRGE